MKIKSVRLFGLVLIAGLLLLLSFSATNAQENQPNPPLPGVLQQDAHGLGYLQKGPAQPGMGLMAVGGPDDFGYAWTDEVPLPYAGASDGTNTGISSSNTVSGAIPIGFTFPFYENSYSQIFVSRHGYASFAAENLLDDQSGLPASAPPNNVIAPHWAPFYNMSTNSYVRYKKVGEVGSRSFVVEWYRMSPYAGALEEYTFSMVLHENGNIDFHYASMSMPDDWYCQSSGIEDSTGQDGLLITPYCTLIPGGHTVQITRPPASPHLAIDLLYQGAFTQAGALAEFEITLTNSGENGADSYNFSIDPPPTWPVSLYAANLTPLVDSNSDGTPDSGLIQQGDSTTVLARVAVPGGAVVGDDNRARVTFCSAQDAAKCKTVTLQLAVPAPFAQVINDGGDMSQAFVQPDELQVAQTGAGYNPAVLQLPNGTFINAWSANRCLTAGCTLSADELWFTLLANDGSTLRAPTKLTDHSGSLTNVSDGSLVMAGAPDGSIGLLWVRQKNRIIDASLQYNYNLFFAIINSQGQLRYAPENLTNNNEWGSLNTPNVPIFFEAAISATGNNRFVLAWSRTHRAVGCSFRDCIVDNIYYSVRSSSGTVQRVVTQLTSDQPSNTYDGHNYPNLTALSGDRALLAWSRGLDRRVYYAVLDSAGNQVKTATLIPEEETPDEEVSFETASFDPDAVQLSNGNIIVTWYTSTLSGNVIRYAVLNPNYEQQGLVHSLLVPTDFSGATYVSVAADNADRAVLTWMDTSWDSRSSLSYALLDSTGAVLTQPIVFYTSQAKPPYVMSNLSGFGNTSYSLSSLPAGVDVTIWPETALLYAKAGAVVPVEIHFANQSFENAPEVIVTVNLPPGLVYQENTSGAEPIITGSSLFWIFANVDFNADKQFGLKLLVPANATTGSHYPVTLAISAVNDLDASNNAASLDIVVTGKLLFLPLLTR